MHDDMFYTSGGVRHLEIRFNYCHFQNIFEARNVYKNVDMNIF